VPSALFVLISCDRVSLFAQDLGTEILFMLPTVAGDRHSPHVQLFLLRLGLVNFFAQMDSNCNPPNFCLLSI
jgi:hypothetical protein